MAEPDPGGLSRDSVQDWVRATWPEDVSKALAVAECESDYGQHPATYDLSRPSGGPMQIERIWDHTIGAGWEQFFWAKYGWTWEQVVTDLSIHFRAAREIYDRAGGWSPWTCA